MKTLNQISNEIYGRNYNHLPDDGAEQDHVQHAFANQKDDVFTAEFIRDTIAKDFESDLPDRVIEALRPFDGKPITTRILKALPALPNGATWRLIRHYGWTCLQTSTYCQPQGYRDGTSLDLILCRTESSVPLDVNYVAGLKPMANNSYGENAAYFSARVERNKDRLTAQNDAELCKKTADVMNKYAKAIFELEIARAELDELTKYGTPLHPLVYTLRKMVDPHDKATHEVKQ